MLLQPPVAAAAAAKEMVVGSWAFGWHHVSLEG
jgi:hypothetical protein